MEIHDMLEKNIILLVDDNKAILSLYTDILENSGFQVIGATNGWSAIEALELEGDRIDVMLTDIRMPGMSGYELARKVREIKSHLPIIAHSGLINRRNMRGRYAQLFDAYLIKPCPTEEMLASISEVLPELVH